MATVKQKIEYLDTIKTKRDYFHLSKRVRLIAFDAYAGYCPINILKEFFRFCSPTALSWMGGPQCEAYDDN
ncbi:MAG: hypothetical protein IKU04_05405 [Bacteroidales bacterium]|nr:hypothetical protein [Bacteroidales bacterium]